MVRGKTVKLYTDAGEMEISDIEEYVCGFSYFYVRYLSSETQSFSRKSIHKAMRKLPTGEFRQIHMKKPKTPDRNGEEGDE